MSINLAPWREAHNKQSQWRFGLLLLLSTLLTLTALIVIRQQLILATHAKKAATQSVLTQTRSFTLVKHYQQWKKDKKELSKMITDTQYQQTILHTRLSLLKNISNSVPREVRLTSLELQSHTLRLKGVAKNNTAASQLVRTLQAVPTLHQLSLSDLTTHNTTGIQFLIQATLKAETSDV